MDRPPRQNRHDWHTRVRKEKKLTSLSVPFAGFITTSVGICKRCKLERLLLEGPAGGVRVVYRTFADKVIHIWIPTRICDLVPEHPAKKVTRDYLNQAWRSWKKTGAWIDVVDGYCHTEHPPEKECTCG